jgi:ATP-dependent protease HslVU (ClpYQ) peptidase subunit
MGADSIVCNGGSESATLSMPKIFHKGEFIICGCGAVRGLNLLQFSLIVPEQRAYQSDFSYMCTDFATAVRKCFAENEALVDTDDGKEMLSDLVVGYKGNIYYVGSDFDVQMRADNFVTSGCGYPQADGALHALLDLHPDMDIREVVHRALQAVQKCNCKVREPFTILEYPVREGGASV